MLWIDGREIDAPEALDRGLEFGDGLFETMAVREGRVRLLDGHLERLGRGCQRLGMVMPERAILEQEIALAAAVPGVAMLKLVLTRGAGGVGYGVVTGRPTRRYLYAGPARRAPLGSREGARVARLPTPLASQPRLAGLKHLNRLEQVLLRGDVTALGVDEGLVADAEGRLVSGVMSNVFLVIEGRVVTPMLERCGIDGVMRAALIHALGVQGTAVEIRDVEIGECDYASEIFLTNALVGVWPVVALDGKTLDIGPWALRLKREVASW